MQVNRDRNYQAHQRLTAELYTAVNSMGRSSLGQIGETKSLFGFSQPRQFDRMISGCRNGLTTI